MHLSQTGNLDGTEKPHDPKEWRIAPQPKPLANYHQSFADYHPNLSFIVKPAIID